MKEENRLYLEWSMGHPQSDALLTREIREFVSQQPVMEECGVIEPEISVPPAVKRRQQDPNP